LYTSLHNTSNIVSKTFFLQNLQLSHNDLLDLDDFAKLIYMLNPNSQSPIKTLIFFIIYTNIPINGKNFILQSKCI
jgi:hypothetical protein